jgi:acyl carrier protein
MSEKTIEQRLKNIVSFELGVRDDLVKPESRFIEDLGADSLDIIELIMAVEEEFGIVIPDEDIWKLTTFGAALDYIDTTNS